MTDSKCDCGSPATFMVMPLDITDHPTYESYRVTPPPSPRFASCDQHLTDAISYVMGSEFTKVLVRRES